MDNSNDLRQIYDSVIGFDEEGQSKACVHLTLSDIDETGFEKEIEPIEILYSTGVRFQRQGQFVTCIFESEDGTMSEEMEVLQRKLEMFAALRDKEAMHAENDAYTEQTTLFIDVIPEPASFGFIRMVNPVMWAPVAEWPEWDCHGFKVIIPNQCFAILEADLTTTEEDMSDESDDEDENL